MSRKPKKARVTDGLSAWWYDERGGISVYIETHLTGARVFSCRIKRSDLVKYIKRTEPK